MMENICILSAVALIASAIGFYRYIYFISVGYGFSVAGLGIALLLLFGANITAGGFVSALLLVIYGIRLGGYIALRERKASYKKAMRGEIKGDMTPISLWAKLGMWIGCMILYVCEVSPILFRMESGAGDDISVCIGIFIMAAGVILESIADWQKNKAKKKNPSRFCDTGLYRFVRCPNYFGEMLFWTGVFVIGAGCLRTALQWIMALFGYVGIIYIMFSGARRLELRQNKNYGSDASYKEYARKTPILIPFIPLYSVEKYKFLIG